MKFKESEIDWLGAIPKHWVVDRVKDIFFEDNKQISKEQIQDKHVVSHYSLPAFDEGRKPKIEPGDEISSGKKLISNGHLLFSKLNCWKPRVWLIKDASTDFLNVASTEFIVLKPWHQTKVCREYYEYLLSSVSFINALKIFIKSVTNSHQRIQPNDLLTMVVPYPPVKEQIAIVEYLHFKCNTVDKIIKLICGSSYAADEEDDNSQVKILLEYKSSLIHEVVTGKKNINEESTLVATVNSDKLNVLK